MDSPRRPALRSDGRAAVIELSDGPGLGPGGGSRADSPYTDLESSYGCGADGGAALAGTGHDGWAPPPIERCMSCISKLGAMSRSSTATVTAGQACWEHACDRHSISSGSDSSSGWSQTVTRPPARPPKPGAGQATPSPKRAPPTPCPPSQASCYDNYDVPKLPYPVEPRADEHYDTPRKLKECIFETVQRPCGCVLRIRQPEPERPCVCQRLMSCWTAPDDVQALYATVDLSKKCHRTQPTAASATAAPSTPAANYANIAPLSMNSADCQSLNTGCASMNSVHVSMNSVPVSLNTGCSLNSDCRSLNAVAVSMNSGCGSMNSVHTPMNSVPVSLNTGCSLNSDCGSLSSVATSLNSVHVSSNSVHVTTSNGHVSATASAVGNNNNYENMEFAQTLGLYENGREMAERARALCSRCGHAQDDYLMMGPHRKPAAHPGYLPMSPAVKQRLDRALSSSNPSLAGAPERPGKPPGAAMLHAGVYHRRQLLDSTDNLDVRRKRSNSADSSSRCEEAEGSPCHCQQSVAVRRSSSVPCKSNRDSSSSNDSGVFELPRRAPSGGPAGPPASGAAAASGAPPRRSRSSDPLRDLSFHFAKGEGKSASAEAEVPLCPTGSTSSGTSDMSDYFETLSLSSHSSSDAAHLPPPPQPPPSCTLRPRSGNEYLTLQRLIAPVPEERHN